MRQRRAVARRLSVVVARAAAVAVVATVLGGCGAAVPEPSPSPSSSPSASAEPSAEPTLVPEASAQDNRAYFDSVNSGFLAAAPMPGGRPIIDNLVTAGFDKAAMQVTPDQTAIGGAVDSVQFSVRFGAECLIGQTSAAAGYTATVGPTIDGTNCLPGVTRAIDW